MKDDGSLNINGEITDLMKTMLIRRSYRKYYPGTISEQQIKYLQDVCKQAKKTWRCPAVEIKFEMGRQRFGELVRAAQSNLLGKTNAWLGFAKAEGMILVVADLAAAPVFEDRVQALAQAAMVMEAVVLAAAEQRLATCWMAAIDHDAIAKVVGLTGSQAIVAASPLGFPPKKKSLSWDLLVNKYWSSKRKKLSEIVFSDTVEKVIEL
jgi:nitroreductase